MKKIKFLIINFLLVMVFLVTSIGVNAADYEVTIYDGSEFTSGSEVTIESQIGDTDDKVSMIISSGLTYGNSKSLVSGITFSSNTNGGTRCLTFKFPAGYSIESFKVKCDAKTNVRNIALTNNASSTTAADNTVSATTSKSTTTTFEMIETAISGTESELVYYFYTSGSIGISGVSATLSKASDDEVAIAFYHGDNLLATQAYENGETIDYVPTVDNYEFVGWYTDSELTTALADDYTVDGSITKLYGKFTENAKVTVTYVVDGVEEVVEEYVGTSLSSKELDITTKKFVGWYLDETYTNQVDADYTFTEDVTLYAKLVALTNYVNISNIGSSTSTITEDTVLDGSIFKYITGDSSATVDTSNVSYDDTKYTHRLKTGGASSENKRVFEFTTSGAGLLKVLAVSGKDGETRNVVLYNSSFTALSTIASYLNTSAAKADYAAGGGYLEFTISEAGTYYLGNDTNSVSFYYIEFIPAPQLEAQYSADGSVLRFIGTIYSDGTEFAVGEITTDIASVRIVMTLDGSAEVTKQIWTIYSSVLSGTEEIKGLTDNYYYSLFVLKGIENYKEKVLTAKLVVTYTDGTVMESQVKNITIGE